MCSFLKVSIALIALFTSTLLARSDGVPTLNVEPLCRGIFAQAANPTETGGPDLTFKACVTSERAVRSDLAKVLANVCCRGQRTLRSIGEHRRGVELYGTDNLPGNGTGREETAFKLHQRN